MSEVGRRCFHSRGASPYPVARYVPTVFGDNEHPPPPRASTQAALPPPTLLFLDLHSIPPLASSSPYHSPSRVLRRFWATSARAVEPR